MATSPQVIIAVAFLSVALPGLLIAAVCWLKVEISRSSLEDI